MQEEIEEALRILEEFSESTKRTRRDSTDDGTGKEPETEEVTESENEGEKRRTKRRSRFSSIYAEKSEKRGSKSMVSLPVEVFSEFPERRPSLSLPSRSSIMECTVTGTPVETVEPLATVLETLQAPEVVAIDFDNSQFKQKENLDDFIILDLSQKKTEVETTCTICYERGADYQLNCLDQFCSVVCYLFFFFFFFFVCFLLILQFYIFF